MIKPTVSLLLLSLMITACGGNQTVVTPATEAVTEAVTEAAVATAAVVGEAPQTGRLGTVSADVLNVRQSADATSTILYEAPRGTELRILAETSRGDSLWYQVKATSNQLPQTPGWAFSRYINVSGESALSTDTPLAAAPSGSQAYKEGYERGYRDGENFQQYGSGYNPEAAYGGGPQNLTPGYNEIYRKGFEAGFEQGYNGKAYDATPPG